MVSNGTSNITSPAVMDERATWEIVLELGSLALVGILGTFGNILVLVSVAWSTKLRKPSNSFICNLSISDLIITSIIIPILVPTRLHRNWLLGDVMCSLHAFLVFLSVYTSLFTLGAIAINRLIMVRWPEKYPKVFTPRNTLIFNLLLWVVAVCCCSPPLLGWGRYVYDTKRDNCLFDRKAAPSYSLFMAAVCISLPLITTAVCYIMIFVTVVKKKRQIQQHGSQRPNGFTPDQLRLTKNLFVVWVSFFICWAPMNFMLFTDPKGLISRPYYMAAIWLLLANSCINPILYGIMNRSFRAGQYLQNWNLIVKQLPFKK